MTMNEHPFSRRDYRKQERLARLRDELDLLRSRSSHHGEQAYLTQKRQERITRIQQEAIQDEPQLAFAKSRDVIRHLCFGLLIVASGFISLVLIYAPAEYLIQQNIGKHPLTGVAVVVLSIVLTVSQVAVAILYHEAREKRAWQVLSKAMAAFTAGMIVATEIARYVGLEQWPWPHDVIALILKMTIAFGFDAAIIYNGEALLSALSFLWFCVQNAYLEYRRNRLTVTLSKHVSQVREHYSLYQQKRAAYVREVGEPVEDPLPPFDNTTQWILKEWLDLDQGQSS